ncbi:50S ribosomal protein L14 [Candidatus Micrarchaeota archaeon CG10_big_fil_rev_8_21_14_0_10_45_29]|nr:MAG: 50S ribosomal protein L14 [Candidatus Micrarchaeota archaeon CG10_big_fil_rev_8_21_14_0_10_45_29]
MKGLTTSVTRCLQVGSRMACNDNSGAKIVQIIGIKGAKAKHAMYPKAGVGDIVTVSVKKGKISMKGKVLKAVIIRQKKMFRRPNGMRICFEDNAVVIIDDNGLPVGTEIKGAIAREVSDRFPKVAAIAPAVV